MQRGSENRGGGGAGGGGGEVRDNESKKSATNALPANSLRPLSSASMMRYSEVSRQLPAVLDRGVDRRRRGREGRRESERESERERERERIQRERSRYIVPLAVNKTRQCSEDRLRPCVAAGKLRSARARARVRR